ncbi:MAG: lipoyl(octanoyl) transferase LipB [archaeon]|nr:lipoyl(octanoyl) transferase LipB [archaeon]MDA0842991.1 lipoyl(octanoyl) transferase LipB [archaeon]MDA1168496.1 lipoyl(octanoyl) transferase LipB [archaeon]
MRVVNLDVRNIVDYHTTDQLMRQMQMDRIEQHIGDTLLVLEHPEVVTIGPKARNEGKRPPLDYAIFDVDRGGGLTWHGPGQLVLYPIFLWDFDNENSVQKIIYKIEEWVIQALSPFEIHGTRDERMQGVWVNGHKICSIGLSFLRWVSRHGFTINYNTPPGRVEGVQGCGLEANTTTSLHQLGYEIEKEDLLNSLIDSMPMCMDRKVLDNLPM